MSLSGKFQINFLDHSTTLSNEKTQFEKYFEQHNPDDWKVGSGGGSFIYVDENNQEYSIVLIEDERYGFLLMYEPSNNGCYSLGNPELLNQFHTNHDEITMPVGTYISIDRAWLVIQDFLENPTVKSDKIEWVSDDDIEWSDDIN